MTNIKSSKENRPRRAITFSINRHCCASTSGTKKILLRSQNKWKKWTWPGRFWSRNASNTWRRGDCLTACGKLTLLVRLDVNWSTSEELSHLLFRYKIVNQTEITCISLIEVVTKMKLISCILLNKTSKNSLRPVPETWMQSKFPWKVSVCGIFFNWYKITAQMKCHASHLEPKSYCHDP